MAEATLLIVDDEPVNLAMLGQLLRPDYTVRVASSGAAALRAVATPPRPDLLLLDISMPGMDGFEVLRRLRADNATQDIPVIFVTAMAASSDEEHGLALGAQDYITKPIKPAVLLARLRTQLEAKRARDWMRDQNAWLEAEVARRMSENDLSQQAGIRALAHLAEIRDPETGNHIGRTQRYVRELALQLRSHPRFAAVLTDRFIGLLTRSAPLHDIGKVGIPDTILLKPGLLTPEEREVMRSHARLGSEAIELAEHDVAQPVAFLSLAKEIAHWHHERWNGSGYPDGLAGDEIPVSARIMAIADVFDALISPRVYKRPLSPEEVRDLIAKGRGTQFDPDMVDAFLGAYDRFTDIAARYNDQSIDPGVSRPLRLGEGP
ncbi:MAG: two-component system response regulator [Rubrivivax sp.]|nr:two-component system response regulator [Rubrivivax sp.]